MECDRSRFGRAWGASRREGQSLTEFALVLPVLLLLVLVALDFGRVFYSWVTLTNATRIAASYASANATAPYPNSTYTAQYQTETNGLSGTCTPQGAPFLPQFADGPDSGTTTKDPGDSVTVSMTCNFRILTPVIGTVFGGGNIRITAASTFTVRSGAFLP